jgi:hypothetical protein
MGLKILYRKQKIKQHGYHYKLWSPLINPIKNIMESSLKCANSLEINVKRELINLFIMHCIMYMFSLPYEEDEQSNCNNYFLNTLYIRQTRIVFLRNSKYSIQSINNKIFNISQSFAQLCTLFKNIQIIFHSIDIQFIIKYQSVTLA